MRKPTPPTAWDGEGREALTTEPVREQAWERWRPRRGEFNADSSLKHHASLDMKRLWEEIEQVHF